MKRWIAIFSLLIFVTAGTAPVIASVLNSNISMVQVDKDPKKDEKKTDKKAQKEKNEAAAACEAKASSEACVKTGQTCGEEKESEGKAVAEKK